MFPPGHPMSWPWSPHGSGLRLRALPPCRVALPRPQVLRLLARALRHVSPDFAVPDPRHAENRLRPAASQAIPNRVAARESLKTLATTPVSAQAAFLRASSACGLVIM